MKDFIPYEEALELNKLGFELDKDSVFGYWNLIEHGKDWWTFDTRIHMDSVDYIEAPTFSQAFRFFREKYDLQCWIHDGGYVGKCCIKITGYNHDKFYFSSSEPMEYEEAELDCLKGLIELVKQKQ